MIAALRLCRWLVGGLIVLVAFPAFALEGVAGLLARLQKFLTAQIERRRAAARGEVGR